MANGPREENLSEITDRFQLATIIDDMWKALVHFFWIVALIVLGFSGIFYLHGRLTYKPQYQAYCTFVVNTETAYGYSNSFYNNAVARQLSSTFPYILTSGVLEEIVADRM